MEAAEAQEHIGFWFDPHSWVLISALVFAAVVYIKGRKPLLAMLDSRSARIKADLDEAARLKAEAEALLADYQKKHADAVVTAQKIVDNARESAALLQKEAEAKLSENLQRREGLLLERIARAEAAAVRELRYQAADIAAKAAEQLLADKSGQRGGELIDEAIKDIPTRAA